MSGAEMKRISISLYKNYDTGMSKLRTWKIAARKSLGMPELDVDEDDDESEDETNNHLKSRESGSASESESESESESDSEEEFIPKRVRHKRRPKAQSRVREPRPQREQRPQRSPEEDAYNHRMNNAFQSLFPNF